MTITLNSSPQNIRNILVKFGQGAFFAHHAAAIDIATATTLKLTADTEIVDVCGWFADSVFTPKMPGYYLLFGSANVVIDADWSAGTGMSLFVRKNGATPAYVFKSGIAGQTDYRTVTGNMQALVILEANGAADYFDLAASHNDGQTVAVSDVTFGGVLVSYNKP